MNFKEYDSAMARVYELGSYAIGHQQYPITFFRQANLPILNGKPVRWLEGGCGTLRYSLGLLKVLKERGEDISSIIIDAFDLSEPMLKLGERKTAKKGFNENIRIWRADGHDLTYAHAFYNKKTNGKTNAFPEESYDGGITSGMLECIPDPVKAAREFSRRIKPGGMIIVPLVNNNAAGKIASKILRFNIMDPDILKEFNADFEKVPVRVANKYLEELTTVWVGYKKS